MGAAELLQMVDELVQFLGGAEQYLDQHAVIPGNAVALHHVGAALDVRVELRLALGVHIQIDEGFDRVAGLGGVDLGLIAGKHPFALQPGDAGGNGRAGKEHPVGDLLQRRAGVLLQNVDDLAVDVIHNIPPALSAEQTDFVPNIVAQFRMAVKAGGGKNAGRACRRLKNRAEHDTRS